MGEVAAAAVEVHRAEAAVGAAVGVQAVGAVRMQQEPAVGA